MHMTCNIVKVCFSIIGYNIKIIHNGLQLLSIEIIKPFIGPFKY